MPFTIVFDHARSHIGRRLWRRISSLFGSLLLVIGLTASIPAVPANLAVVGIVLGWLTTEPSDPDAFPPPDMPVPQIILAWAACGSVCACFGAIGRWSCFCAGSAMTRRRAR
jgi:hypothetical protein